MSVPRDLVLLFKRVFSLSRGWIDGDAAAAADDDVAFGPTHAQ